MQKQVLAIKKPSEESLRKLQIKYISGTSWSTVINISELSILIDNNLVLKCLPYNKARMFTASKQFIFSHHRKCHCIMLTQQYNVYEQKTYKKYISVTNNVYDET